MEIVASETEMEPFIYEQFDLRRPAIRLLRLLKGKREHDIECELFQTYLEGYNITAYHALSYTWGGTKPAATVKVNGKTLGVTENLYLALQHLRKRDTDLVLWVDAICIDQSNVKERGHQVQQMANVYSKAKEVIIWLGPATLETDLVMHTLQELEKQQSKHAQEDWKISDHRWIDLWSSVLYKQWTLYPHRFYSMREGMVQLLNRPWFGRVWILQEVANAQTATIHSGTRAVPSYLLALASSIMSTRPNGYCQAVLDIMPGISREDSWWNIRRDLNTLLRQFNHSQASDPRDLVYALLGLSSDARGTSTLRPDYSQSVQEVIRSTVLFLLKDAEVSYESLQRILAELPSLRKAYVAERGHRLTHDTVGALSSADISIETATFVMLSDLFESYPDRVTLTEKVVIAAASNREYGRDVMELLLRQFGDDLKINEIVLEAAGRNPRCGEQVLQVILPRLPEVEITRLLLAATRGHNEDTAILHHPNIKHWMLQKRRAVAENKPHGAVITSILLKRANANIHVTQDMLVAAAGNNRGAAAMLKLLLEHSKAAHITPEVLLAAAGNIEGNAVMQVLLERSTNLRIGEDIVIATGDNWLMCNEIMMVLLSHPSAHICKTPKTVNTIVRLCNVQVITRLLDRYGEAADMHITKDAVIEAICRQSLWRGNAAREAIAALLFDRFSNILPRGEVFLAAAGFLDPDDDDPYHHSILQRVYQTPAPSDRAHSGKLHKHTLELLDQWAQTNRTSPLWYFWQQYRQTIPLI